jgi:hypothetical protein
MLGQPELLQLNFEFDFMMKPRDLFDERARFTNWDYLSLMGQ